MSALRSLSLCMLLSVCAAVAPAATIVSITDGQPPVAGVTGGKHVEVDIVTTITYYLNAVGWTATSDYQNVQITANLSFINNNLTAYLMRAIGPGTTVADQVATASINSVVAGGTPLFSGLTLPAGSYYLVLHGGEFSYTWYMSDPTPILTQAPGVTFLDSFYSATPTDPPYPPAASFTGRNGSITADYLFSVTGDPVNVPEPSTGLAGIVAAGLMIAWRRRRTRPVAIHPQR